MGGNNRLFPFDKTWAAEKATRPALGDGVLSAISPEQHLGAFRN
jgi:hypothetical protein